MSPNKQFADAFIKIDREVGTINVCYECDPHRAPAIRARMENHRGLDVAYIHDYEMDVAGWSNCGKLIKS